MLIDIIYVALMLIAFIKGLKRGFIRSLFSFLAFWVGLAAAIKFSLVATRILSAIDFLNNRWLPFISFISIFILFSIGIKKIGLSIHKTTEAVSPGFFNSIAGGLFYFCIYSLIFCVFLVYLYNMDAFGAEMLFASKAYKFIFPQAIKMLKLVGNVIPIFKNIFA